MRFLGIAVLQTKRNVYHNLIKQKAVKLKDPKFYRLFYMLKTTYLPCYFVQQTDVPAPLQLIQQTEDEA